MTDRNPQGRRLRRTLPAPLWVAALYLATAINEALPHPEHASPLIEARQVAIHLIGYAILAALVAYGLGEQGVSPAHIAALAIGLAPLLGLGQEALQTVLRQEFGPVGSGVDLLVDTLGAAAGLHLYRRLVGKSSLRVHDEIEERTSTEDGQQIHIDG
ncbi:MAG: hypothetical protein Kow00124_25590 [Anaerolineae bacterium]